MAEPEIFRSVPAAGASHELLASGGLGFLRSASVMVRAQTSTMLSAARPGFADDGLYCFSDTRRSCSLGSPPTALGRPPSHHRFLVRCEGGAVTYRSRFPLRVSPELPGNAKLTSFRYYLTLV